MSRRTRKTSHETPPMLFDVYDFQADEDSPALGQISVETRGGEVDEQGVIDALVSEHYDVEQEACQILPIEESDYDHTDDDAGVLLVFEDDESDEPLYELIPADVIEGEAEDITDAEET